VLLEWDYSQGQPPAPLLKDKYGSERRKVGIEGGREGGERGREGGREGGRVLLAWDRSPLLKDNYGSERRKLGREGGREGVGIT